MSRSRRKTPIISNVCGNTSEKMDKRIANRNFRRINKTLINGSLISERLEDIIFVHKTFEVSDTWGFNKDGKHYLDKNSEYYDDKYMRK